MLHTLYRIVHTDPPAPRDFTSARALGIPPRNYLPETLRLHDGLSVFATATQARNKAEDYPWLGKYVAELRLPDPGPVRREKTLGRGHHTIWGDPSEILACVALVMPAGVVK